MLWDLYRFIYLRVRIRGWSTSRWCSCRDLGLAWTLYLDLDPVTQTLNSCTISDDDLKATFWKYLLEKSTRKICLAARMTWFPLQRESWFLRIMIQTLYVKEILSTVFLFSRLVLDLVFFPSPDLFLPTRLWTLVRAVLRCPGSGLYPVRGQLPTRWQSSPWRAAFADEHLFLLAKLPPLSSTYLLIASIASFCT